jgi:hypothetical protein
LKNPTENPEYPFKALFGIRVELFPEAESVCRLRLVVGSPRNIGGLLCRRSILGLVIE